MKKKATAALLAASLGFGLSISAASAAPSPYKNACKNGGYANFVDPSTGQPFKNQGQCVAAANRGPLTPVDDGGEEVLT